MRVVVLGAGSWGTTVASLVAGRGRHPTMLWARNPDVAEEIDKLHTNCSYLAGFELAPGLLATADLEEAVSQAELLIVGVSTHAFRATLEAARPCIHLWIPVVSLAKGLERDSLLRMTQVIKDVVPGHPAATLTGPNIAHETYLHQRGRGRLRARRRPEERRGHRLRHGPGARLSATTPAPPS
jgi:glycerol-3-phosphate dehydrogenase (NAD(P)+)